MNSDISQAANFRTTHWSVVLRAADLATPESKEALESLCRAYWYPLYVFVRRRGSDAEEAQDLTQEFFARFLETDSLQSVHPDRGRFRTFLLAALKNFLAKEWRDANRALRFSPDSTKLLIAAGNDKIEPGTAMLLEVPSLKPAFRPLAHGDGVAFADISPDGRLLATGGEDNVVRLWRAADGATAAAPMRHFAIVNALSFEPSGPRLAAGGYDGFLRVWDVTRGELCGPGVPLGFSTPSVLFALNGRSVLAATHTEGAWILSLEPAHEAYSELNLVASGQTALRSGRSGALEQTPVSELAAQYAASAARLTAFTDPDQRLAWHEGMALRAESSGEAFVAAFHLERLAKLRPGDPVVAARLQAARKLLPAK